ncbi:dolichyl-diphosphooligosaccharide--protein glycosyltransferase subunit DAD1 [Tanacetum coccineum]
MLEWSTGIVGVTKATLGSEIQNPGRANGVLSYFSLKDKGVAAGSPKDQGRAEEQLRRFARIGDLPPERAFAEFVLCNLVMHLVIMNFLG